MSMNRNPMNWLYKYMSTVNQYCLWLIYTYIPNASCRTCNIIYTQYRVGLMLIASIIYLFSASLIKI